MGTIETRKEKVEWILSRLARNKSINKEKLIADFCLELGSTNRTCRELLDQLKAAGLIVVDKTQIHLRGK